MSQTLQRLLSASRRQKGFTQKEVAHFAGMTRENYASAENGRRKDPLSPEQASRLARLLDIPMISLLEAMGYSLDVPGFDNEEEVALVQAYRRLTPAEKRMLRAAAGLPSSPLVYQAAASRGLQIADRPGNPEASE